MSLPKVWKPRKQVAFLTGHGCQWMQGYYFGRPEPARHFCPAAFAEQHG